MHPWDIYGCMCILCMVQKIPRSTLFRLASYLRSLIIMEQLQRNKERTEKRPTMLFRLLSRFFPFWSGNWVEHLKLHFLSSSFHLVFLSKEADTSYWPNKDQYLPTWKTFLSCYFPPCTELPDSLFPSLNSVFNAIPEQIKKGYNHFLYSFPAYKKHCLIHL